MIKTIVYTFRTFPYQDELKTVFPDVLVLGKIKEDLERLFELIEKEKPDIILGVAKSESTLSVFEPVTVNRFNKDKKIIKNGKKELKLFIPELTNTTFKLSKKPTTSFCNYSMYKIQEHVEQKGLKTKVMFTHLNEASINELSLLSCFFQKVYNH